MEQNAGTNLRKFVAPECVFGADARLLAGKYAYNIGARKVMIVTDPGVIAAGWTKDVISCLVKVGISSVVFKDVNSNPRENEIMSGAEIYQSENCNCIIAVGGGSPIDCAKGIGIVSTNKRHILEFEGVDEVESPIPPLICIPTTGGSAADISQFAVITDSERKVKIVIASKSIVPDVSLVDPVTLTTMPTELAANTGVDVLTHAIEAYVSNANSPITDLFALESIRLITKNLLASIENPLNIEMREKVSLASSFAGFAFSNAGIGLVHAMAHGLGGFFNSPHGESNAILLKHVIHYNYPCAGERYRTIGETMGLNFIGMNDTEAEHALVNEIDRFQVSVGASTKLDVLGIKKSDIPTLAEIAIGDNACIATNPREPTIKDIEEIYARAL